MGGAICRGAKRMRPCHGRSRAYRWARHRSAPGNTVRRRRARLANTGWTSGHALRRNASGTTMQVSHLAPNHGGQVARVPSHTGSDCRRTEHVKMHYGTGWTMVSASCHVHEPGCDGMRRGCIRTMKSISTSESITEQYGRSSSLHDCKTSFREGRVLGIVLEGAWPGKSGRLARPATMRTQ